MLKQSRELSSKIKIAMEHEKTDFSTTDYYFYSRYSIFTLKALRKYAFQEFLYRMLKSESIPEKKVDSVKIEVFPAPRKNGFTIAGKCNTIRGKIRIYPKTVKFCAAFKKKYGKDILVAYAGNRARASLMHELLHLKYVSDEEKVRALTKTYFSSFTKGFANNSNSESMYKLIFDATTSPPCNLKAFDP